MPLKVLVANAPSMERRNYLVLRIKFLGQLSCHLLLNCKVQFKGKET